jgi:glycosyltransferase involved in cell wall biosynthesis
VTLPRLALLFDFAEEGWVSMDLTAEMLWRGLAQGHAGQLAAEPVCPPFRRRLTRLPALGGRRLAVNADRGLNRHWDYPRYLTGRCGGFDLFHVCDHSYAQLVHALPAERTGVYCHDLDAFRCLLEPRQESRPRWFRALARRTLGGLQRAALVFHNSLDTGRRIERHGLVDPARLVHAPLGVAEEFCPEPDGEVAGIDGPYLLHVGSCVPRKRIDVLFDVFAALRDRFPGLRLVKVGAAFSDAQKAQIDRLRLAPDVVALHGLKRGRVAALYRGAAAVLLPSEAEGFGLPLIESLACGSLAVASDLPVLREVGGEAAVYCPVGDVPAWVEAVSRLLADPASAPPRALRLARAARFTWAAHARTVATAYLRLLA